MKYFHSVYLTAVIAITTYAMDKEKQPLPSSAVITRTQRNVVFGLTIEYVIRDGDLETVSSLLSTESGTKEYFAHQTNTKTNRYRSMHNQGKEFYEQHEALWHTQEASRKAAQAAVAKTDK